MYENKVHSVENRIVSITQPWIRPIVRGKTKAPVEFGTKFDLSVDDNGLGRIEKISYDAYNESTVLIEAVERFRERTGHYPERLLADQIYRTRDNRNFCKTHGIRLSDSKLGRPSLAMQSAKEKKQEYARIYLDKMRNQAYSNKLAQWESIVFGGARLNFEIPQSSGSGVWKEKRLNSNTQ